jgi:hypothetical protein
MEEKLIFGMKHQGDVRWEHGDSDRVKDAQGGLKEALSINGEEEEGVHGCRHNGVVLEKTPLVVLRKVTFKAISLPKKGRPTPISVVTHIGLSGPSLHQHHKCCSTLMSTDSFSTAAQNFTLRRLLTLDNTRTLDFSFFIFEQQTSILHGLSLKVIQGPFPSPK